MSSANITMDDIDTETVKQFVKLATAKGRLPKNIDNKNIEKLFVNLELINDGLLTRGAVLLFGKKPTRFFKNAIIKMGRFRAEDSKDILVHDEIKGNLFSIYDTALELLRSKYLWSPISYEGSIRLETLEIPEKALRETLLNSLVHKDYTSNSAISVRIFDSRLSVWNSGKLTELKVEDLKKDHNSHKRNPVIADIFFRAGFIESWGRGTNTIVEECVNSGLEEPIFREQEGGLEVSIKRDPMRLTEKGADKPATQLFAELTPRQQKAIDYIRENGNISNKIYQDINNCSDATAKRDLKELVEANILKASGKTRRLVYMLIGSIRVNSGQFGSNSGQHLDNIVP
jgi:ATP-dependent DNA helicase RecG